MAVKLRTAPDFLLTETGFVLDRPDLPLTEEATALQQAFLDDPMRALYQVGLAAPVAKAGPSFVYLQTVAASFFRTLMQQPGLELAREHVELADTQEEIARLVDMVPFVLGSEYVDEAWVGHLFDGLLAIFASEMQSYAGSVELYFTEKNQRLRVPERIFFHLVESRRDDYPFAFMATYATETDGRVRHVPLEYALTEFGSDNHKLREFLACLNGAADVCPLIADFIRSGELFHPLYLDADEAYQFLLSIEAIEKAGIICRIPNWWKKHTSTPQLSAQMGGDKPSLLGFDSIISVMPTITLDGTPLTREEIESLLAQTEGLHQLKGKWIEVNHQKLRDLLQTMDHMPENVTFLEVVRGEVPMPHGAEDEEIVVTNGQWIHELLQKLRRPTLEAFQIPDSFQATLRPYQQTGTSWLYTLAQFGFGACLADDMGLGKTVQVLCFLEQMRVSKPDVRALLIVPASLLGNWEKEILRFAPQMPYHLLHGRTSAKLSEEVTEPVFLTITTYGMATRLVDALQGIPWQCVILDEAQAIKNPGTKQTKAIKKLRSPVRIAMTGTPIENELGNLWSLFDFLDPGLLGSNKQFRDFCKGIGENDMGYVRLRSMVSPFLLRRLKTDKRIIADLPEKLEMIDYAAMSKKQITLYKKAVSELQAALDHAEDVAEREQELRDAGWDSPQGASAAEKADLKAQAQEAEQTSAMRRRGIILATISKLKQICNHPDQYLGQDGYDEKESGKMALLRDICETIYEKRERVLVFTQFKEICEPLSRFLTEVFGMPGLIIHGGVPVKRRQALVDQFQGDAYVPYMILSVRAGGTGLNLTRANHVIHFDRWWNPAVEDQATDRAFRIGQKRNVMVHKLVCTGTIEEKIDQMIQEKQALSRNVIGADSGEQWITEMSNQELIHLMQLE